jgi:cytochrome c biogenesis protein
MMKQVADDTAKTVAEVTGVQGDDMREKIAMSIVNVLDLFASGGFDAIASFVEQQVPAEQQEKTLSAYVRMVQTAIAAVYLEVLKQEGVDLAQGVDDEKADWFDAALQAMTNLPAYGAPFYASLKSFEHVEASGLQITRKPGQDVFYLGCVMLMIGVFLMFYTLQRRFWLQLVPTDQGSLVLLAGSGQRNPREFNNEFNKISSLIDSRLGQYPDQS